MAGNYTSPITTRVIDVPYKCPFFPGYSDLNPTPLVVMACVSESGSAELKGFDEFLPSSPPRKYLLQTLSGRVFECVFAGAHCVGEVAGGGSIVRNYTGSWVYNPTTGAITGGGIDTENWADGPAVCGTSVYNHSINAQSLPWAIGVAGLVAPTLTATEKKYNGNNCPTTVVKAADNAKSTLTNEDTYATAAARVVVTPGASCTALIDRSGDSFLFDFVNVGYDLDFSPLVPGRQYRATVDLVEANIGGGSPSTTMKEYFFTATATNHSISDVVVCPTNKQVSATNAQVDYA